MYMALLLAWPCRCDRGRSLKTSHFSIESTRFASRPNLALPCHVIRNKTLYGTTWSKMATLPETLNFVDQPRVHDESNAAKEAMKTYDVDDCSDENYDDFRCFLLCDRDEVWLIKRLVFISIVFTSVLPFLTTCAARTCTKHHVHGPAWWWWWCLANYWPSKS